MQQWDKYPGGPLLACFPSVFSLFLGGHLCLMCSVDRTPSQACFLPKVFVLRLRFTAEQAIPGGLGSPSVDPEHSH